MIVVSALPSLRRGCLAAALSAVAALAAFAPPNALCQTAGRTTFSNSLAPLPPTTAAVKAYAAADARGDKLEFHVAFRIRHFERFQQRVAEGETVPFDELERDYLPLKADYERTLRWFKAKGFEITLDDPRRLGIFARGSVALIADSFQVDMAKATVDGTEYSVARTAPSLPAEVAAGVLSINGLQPYLKFHRHSHLRPWQPKAPGRDVGPTPEVNDAPPLLVPEVLKAYDAASLTATANGTTTTLSGSQQKIAIIIDALPLNSDLTQFWSANGITQSLSNIESVNVPGGTVDATSGEETLDVEWTSGIAPNARVRVYVSDTLSFTNITKCMQAIANDVTGTTVAQPQLHALSISLGLGETYLGAGSGIFTSEAQYLALIANGNTQYGGVSTFVSSGDAGSTPDSTGHANGGPLQAEYESTDPSVTGVGGTALTLDASTGLRSSEVAWASSGGGTSIQFARPSWQVGVGVPSGTMRLAPDVSAVGSGNTAGYLVYKGSVYLVSGTSWSSPIWAGLTAMFNEGRAVNSRTALGLLNPRLYPLIGTSCVYDITSGNNAGGTNANGNYQAGVGYDEVTGIGSPDGANLLTALQGPVVTGFTPTQANAGSSVTINGTGFYSVTAVNFNGTSASFTVNSPTQITAVVPSGTSAGPISVTSFDTATSSGTFTPGVPDLTVTVTHAGTFTQADAADTYAITVTNSGTLATSGTVSLADTLPGGLTATAMSGTGWTVNLGTLTCTRSDALAAGASYQPIALTVSVAATAPASVTNTVMVSGGNETNTTNDSASDMTPITALTPSQSWRYQYFQTTADSGNAADTANPAGDGLDNLLKYAFGLNPLVSTANPVVVDISTGFLRLTAPKNSTATDVMFSVEITSDLTNWSTMGLTVDQDSSTELQVQDNTPVSGTPERFIRLRVTRN